MTVLSFLTASFRHSGSGDKGRQQGTVGTEAGPALPHCRSLPLRVSQASGAAGRGGLCRFSSASALLQSLSAEHHQPGGGPWLGAWCLPPKDTGPGCSSESQQGGCTGGQALGPLKRTWLCPQDPALKQCLVQSLYMVCQAVHSGAQAGGFQFSRKAELVAQLMVSAGSRLPGQRGRGTAGRRAD